MFICNKSKSLNVAIPIITFDQCVWVKTIEEMCAYNEREFDTVLIGFGGLYILMPFLGTFCELVAL